MRILLPIICLVVLVLTLCGCAGYRLGPSNGVLAGDKTVEVKPFVNQTFEPRFAEALTAAVRRDLQRDGTYRLATHDGADIVISGVITKYVRHELSLLPNDVLTAQDYRVNATAQVTARDASTGKVIFDQAITGYTLVRVGTDLAGAERQALPLLAEELAKNVTARLVDGSW
jgi:predicted alpha-1,6-mannanase (GH76 family)